MAGVPSFAPRGDRVFPPGVSRHTMTDRTIPTDDDVEQLKQTVQNGPWEVDEWELDAGMYDESVLLLAVTWAPRSPRSDKERQHIKTVKRVINALAEGREGGAPITEVKDTLVDKTDMDRQTVTNFIKAMIEKGEVYEPNHDQLRTT